MSLLLKQTPVIRRLPFTGGRSALFYCKHCSSNGHDKSTSNTDRYLHNASDNPYPRIMSLDQLTHHSTIFKSKCLIPGSDNRRLSSSPQKNLYRYTSAINQSVSFQTSHSLLSNKSLALDLSICQYRGFQTSVAWRKEESKLEKTVKALKDTAKEKVAEKSTSEASALSSAEEKAVAPVKKTIRQRLVAFAKHYYHGFRLFFIDVKICSKLIWQVLNGKSLTRRESNQLVRTTADMFRMVPLLVFLLVPFAEFLLPVFLYFFPNMLPSTFQEEKTEKEKVKKSLKAKIEMAKFLQKTIKESAIERKHKSGQSVESFATFLDEIKKENTSPNNKDILKFAKLFEDDITLDNLSRQQLRACCIMLNITPIGSDALLRFLLQMRLRGLLADDKVIQKEGLDTLDIGELQAANRARGMRALGINEDRLRSQLRQWLQLHLEEKIPVSLLLLSRTMYLPDTLSAEEKLRATISQMPDTAADEAKAKAAEMEGEKVDNKTKIEIIKREEDIIAAEKEEKRRIEEKDQADRAKAEKKALEIQLDDPTAKTIDTAPVLKDKAEEIRPSPAEDLKKEKEEIPEITSKDLLDVECVLEEVAKAKKIDIELEELKDLKEEITEYKEDLEDLKDAAEVVGADKKEFKESKAAKRLTKKVDKMVKRLDSKLEKLQEEKSSIQDKMERSLEEEMDDSQLAQEEIAKYRSNLVSINDLLGSLKQLRKDSDDQNESKLKKILEVLDQDKDGSIDINQALQVLDQLSQEDSLKLNKGQLEEITNTLKSEEMLEDEEKKEEKEEKEKKEEEKKGQKEQTKK